MKPRILVIRQLGGIGDVLSQSCVYRGLREKYPKHSIALITARIYLGGALLDLAEHNPYIDEIFCYEPFEGSTANTIKVWWKTFGGSPVIDDGSDPLVTSADKVIDLNTACVEYEWAAQPAITKPRYQVWAEKAEVWPLSDTSPIYEIRPEEQKEADEKLKKWEGKTIVGVGISACDNKRALAIERLRVLCGLLRDRGLHPITIDPTFCFEEFDYLIGNRISQLMPLLKRMNTVVTIDSGLLHMAGCVGTPVVGIFGPTDYTMRMNTYVGSAIDSRKLVPCAPCWYTYPCRKHPNENEHFKCLKKIQMSVVAEETYRWATKQKSA